MFRLSQQLLHEIIPHRLINTMGIIGVEYQVPISTHCSRLLDQLGSEWGSNQATTV